MTFFEVCDYCDFKPSQLEKLMKQEGIPVYILNGKKSLFIEEELKIWFQQYKLEMKKREQHILDHLEKRDEAEILKHEWMDGQDVMQMLHISQRTLQDYRDNKILPFSRIRNKIYYKTQVVRAHYDKNYNGPKTDTHGTE